MSIDIQHMQHLLSTILAESEHEQRSLRAKKVWQRRKERENRAAAQSAAYGYVRATNDESLARQSAILEQLAQEHGICILQIFNDDCSGTIEPLRRPGFERIVTSLAKGTAHLVLAVDPTRIARSPSQLTDVHEKLLQLGAEIVYAS